LPAAVFDEFFDKIIDEHIQSDKGQDNKVKDFVDVMLSFVGSEEYEYRIERPNINAILLVKGMTVLQYSFLIDFLFPFKRCVLN